MKHQIEGMIKDNKNIFTTSDSFEMSFTAMGEPLLNYEALIETIRFLENNFSNKKIIAKVSTIGILNRMYELMNETFKIPVLLQISLHSVDNRKRRIIIPYNNIRKTPEISEVIKAGKEYSKKTKNKTIIKYMLITGFNDDKKDIERLASLLDNKHFCIKLAQIYPSTKMT